VLGDLRDCPGRPFLSDPRSAAAGDAGERAGNVSGGWTRLCNGVSCVAWRPVPPSGAVAEIGEALGQEPDLVEGHAASVAGGRLALESDLVA
jgi:hypothetical protein